MFPSYMDHSTHATAAEVQSYNALLLRVIRSLVRDECRLSHRMSSVEEAHPQQQQQAVVRSLSAVSASSSEPAECFEVLLAEGRRLERSFRCFFPHSHPTGELRCVLTDEDVVEAGGSETLLLGDEEAREMHDAFAEEARELAFRFLKSFPVVEEAAAILRRDKAGLGNEPLRQQRFVAARL